ncbi:MAG: hypothetical protein ABL984_03210 [Pyrinomonadaceae bacterium]
MVEFTLLMVEHLRHRPRAQFTRIRNTPRIGLRKLRADLLFATTAQPAATTLVNRLFFCRSYKHLAGDSS